MKRTELKRVKGLQPVTPLRRGQGLSRKPWRRRKVLASTVDMSAPLALVLAAEATVAQAARIHGVDPGALEQLARATWSAKVLEREGYRCADCGARATDAHHRIPLGMGGNVDSKVAYNLANGVGLCRPSHERVHKRGQDTYRRGLWLLRTDDPEAVPVVLSTPSGWVRRWLKADGGVSYEPPAEVA